MTKPTKRPRDFSQAAKFVIDVATGQREDRAPTPEEQGKDPAAAALGKKGGAARRKRSTPIDAQKLPVKLQRSAGPQKILINSRWEGRIQYNPVRRNGDFPFFVNHSRFNFSGTELRRRNQ